MLHFFIISILALIIQSPMQCSVLITGDPQAPADASFSVPIGAYAYSNTTHLLYVALGQATTGDVAPFNLSVTNAISTAFTPLLNNATLTVDNVKAQPNPLLGQPIQLMTLVGMNPAVVATTDTTKLYLLWLNNDGTQIFTRVMQDAENPPQPGNIIAMAGSIPPSEFDTSGVLRSGMTIFSAVAKQNTPFGTVGGGIAKTILAFDSANEETRKFILDQPTGTTAPLDVLSPVIRIGPDPVQMLGSTPILHVSDQLKTLFVGLPVIGNTINPQDGVQTVLRSDTTLAGAVVLNPLVDPALFTGTNGDAIIAVQGPGVIAATLKLQTMRTSTGLWYLVIVGGSGPNIATISQNVFAMPIITNSGALANVNAQPITIFKSEGPSLVVRRDFVVAPESLSDLYSSTSIPAIVGTQPLPAPATDLHVVGDTVFASTLNPTTNAPGIWYSQAIFTTNGTIIAWTPWRLAGGFGTGIGFFELDDFSGNFWGGLSTNGTVNTVLRTLWSLASPLSQVVTQYLHNQGGVQGLIDTPRLTPASDGNAQIALTVATGLHQVCMVQGDDNSSGIITPRTTFEPTFASSNGSLNNFSGSAAALDFSGGALNSIGTIVTAAIVNDGTYGWIVVGGTQGIAVLARPDGTGWPFATGPGELFSELTPDMQWHIIDVQSVNIPFSFIRKLIFDSGNLYILGMNILARLPASAATFASNAQPHASLLATPVALNLPLSATFADLFVLHHFALLATSAGLLRVGNNQAIDLATTPDQLQWTPVTIPYSTGSVTQIFPIGPVARTNTPDTFDGNLYILDASVTHLQARIYRFVLAYQGAVSATTLQIFPDDIITNTPAFFLNIGDYRNFLTTDGAILALSRSRYEQHFTFLEIVNPLWHTWPLGYRSTLMVIRGAQHVIQSDQASRIGHMIRNFASGAWLVPLDIGLITNN